MTTKKMTSKEVLNQFRKEAIHYKFQDDIAIQTAFNFFIDYLHKEDLISDKVADSIIFTEGIRQREARLIQSHIMERYSLEDFKRQIDSMLRYNISVYHTISDLARGGSFLAYNSDIIAFVNKVKKNNKEYPIEKTLDLYYHLIALHGEKLYNNN